MSQYKEELQVHCPSGDSYTLVGRPCEMSAFSFVPTERNLPKERTVFNSDKKVCFLLFVQTNQCTIIQLLYISHFLHVQFT